MVLRCAGKGVDALLAHGEPVGHGNLGPDERLKLGDVRDDDLGHIGICPIWQACRRTAMTTSSKLSLDKEGWREAPGGGLIGGRLTTPPLRGTPPQRGGDNYPCCSPNFLPPPSASPRRAAASRRSTRSR